MKLALKEAGLKYDTEKEFSVFFQDKKIGILKLDLIVQDKVIVEVKAITGNIPDVFKYQVVSYLKVSNLGVGLLVNFGNRSCQIKRFMF